MARKKGGVLTWTRTPRGDQTDQKKIDIESQGASKNTKKEGKKY